MQTSRNMQISSHDMQIEVFFKPNMHILTARVAIIELRCAIITAILSTGFDAMKAFSGLPV